MRTRANGRFVRYFRRWSDFGQRAEYEGPPRRGGGGVVRGVAAGARPRARFSDRTAQWVANLYSGDSIRINDAAWLTPKDRATLVHEYIHAVVIGRGLAAYVEWRYRGSEGRPTTRRYCFAGRAGPTSRPARWMEHGAALGEADRRWPTGSPASPSASAP